MSRRSSHGRTARLRRGKTGVAGAVRLQLSFLPVSATPQPYRCQFRTTILCKTWCLVTSIEQSPALFSICRKEKLSSMPICPLCMRWLSGCAVAGHALACQDPRIGWQKPSTAAQAPPSRGERRIGRNCFGRLPNNVETRHNAHCLAEPVKGCDNIKCSLFACQERCLQGLLYPLLCLQESAGGHCEQP